MSDAEALTRILDDRYSCRAFRSDPLPRDLIEEIVSDAQKVASWCNAQPWQLVVTRAEETDRLREALAEEMTAASHTPDIPFPERYSGIYKERRSTCGWQLYGAVGVQKGDREGSHRQMMENFRFFGAPHVAVLTSEAELGPYGLVDCGGFLTALTLAATARGVATIPQAALASYAPFLHRFFDLPENRTIVCAISMGRADEDHPANSFRTTRAGLDETLRWQG
ncbi:nitroreductase [Nioella sp. MMSF_3534]|uniref:nitroreductase n=1 Tax=Nioella sp. MMSF_3534 TaxID=3046720 RepID=UPI00273E3285|nr:nitroreductase [Nioella sp. MMSF_3534]